MRLSHFWRHAAINLVLGIAIEALIHAFHDAPVVQRAENAGLDAAIAFFGEKGGGDDPEPGLAFTVLDIDDATWSLWGGPNVTPRDKLLQLIRTAVASSAAAVVVDLDLTRKEGDNGLTPSPRDGALGDFIRQYRGAVPIVLARLIRPVIDSIPRWPVPVRPWFDSLPLTGATPVRWGTVQFVEEADGVVRRWRLWEPVCDRGRPHVLPSIQLATGAALDGDSGSARLEAALAEMTPPRCDERELREADLEVFGHHIEQESEEVPERIIYSMAWPPEDGPTRMVRLPGGDVVPMLLRIPAGQVTRTQSLDARLLEGRLVVIGASNADSRDWYATPLGRMPGMMVVANAIESLRRNGQYGTGKSALKWVVVVVLLVLTSLAYARYHPLIATLLILPVIYLAVLPMSFYLFNSGVWLDFTAPLLGVQLHELIASAENAWAQRGRRLPGHG